MSSKLRVLVVEDSETDALLMLRELRNGGYEPDYERLDTKAAMMNALQSREWDVIICDFNMPAFRGDHALSLLKESGLDLPFILLSGTIGEEIAVDMMKAGANDYIMKDNLTRLVPAIQRELREAKNRQEKREAQVALQQSEEKYRTILENIEDGYYEVDLSGNLTFFNESFCKLLAYSEDELMGMNYRQYMDSEVAKGVFQTFNAVHRSGQPARAIDWVIIKADGERRSIEASVSLIVNSTGESVGFRGIARDVTERMEAQKALKDSEERYRTLLQSMHDLVFVIDKHDCISQYYTSSNELLLFPPEEFVDKHVSDVLLPPVAERVAKLLQRVRATGESETLDHQLETGGQVYWFSAVLSSHEDGESIVLVTRDITERKRAEEATRESEARYASILRAAPIGIGAAKDRIFNFVSDTFLEMLGYSREELEGQNARMLFETEGEFQRIRTEWYADIITYGVGTTETRLKRKDGQIIDVLLRSAMLDPEDASAGVTVTILDITDRKAAERALRESEEWFRAIYEESPIAINVFDPDGNLTHANPACVDFAGVSSVEDLKDVNMYEDPNLSDEIKQRIRTGERVLYHSVVDFSKIKETRLYDTSRSGVRHIEAGASPLRYGTDKSLHGYLVQIIDITERVLAEANTKTAAETAMLYLDLMGHDIRNHLQAIIMGTEILEQLDIRPEVREMVDIVSDSVEKSQNLIRKVQATRELLSVPLSNTSLRTSLEDCLQVLNETYDDVQVEVNLASQQSTVMADKYLRHLLMNVLENAILHSDKKTRRVWLDLREAKEGYEVVIADNGPGIDNDKKKNLFDQSRRFGGVGVHQAFKIIQKYRGHISVQDRVPGDSSKGAEFHIWFPKSTA